MTTSPLVSPADAVKNDAGQWSITFTVPSTGDRLQATSFSAERVAEMVNKQIKYDLERMDAEGPYRDAVAALSAMCLAHDGSGAHAAAQVLLSAYNRHFHLDVTDLCNLDYENFAHAMAVIHGRVKCSKEPHSMIADGNEVFRRLWSKWEHLHSQQRYASWYE